MPPVTISALAILVSLAVQILAILAWSALP